MESCNEVLHAKEGLRERVKVGRKEGGIEGQRKGGGQRQKGGREG